MTFKRIAAIIRYLVLIVGVTIGIIVLIEGIAWLIDPGRFDPPPAVTADAWISADALAREDTVWLKEFVDEFCQSYNAHWVPYVYFQRDPFRGKHINVDSNGVRYTTQNIPLAPTQYPPCTILMLGGSTMWGTGARDSGTIPSALARRLAADPALGSTQVINMGESGYVSTQAIIRLELELRAGNIPDLVILYDGVNDVFAAHQNGEAGGPQNEIHRTLEFNLLKEGGRMRRLGWEELWNKTLTAELVNSLRFAIGDPPPSPVGREDIAPDVVRVYRNNLEIVKALSKHFGFRYEVYWQPVVFSRGNPTPYERRQADLRDDVRPLFQEVYRLVRQDSVLNANVHFHNISDIFDTVDKPVYLDFCHITEAGNAIVAERMYKDISTSCRSSSPSAIRRR